MDNSILKKNFNYSITEIESMMPFERDIYIDIAIMQLEQEKEEYERAKESR